MPEGFGNKQYADFDYRMPNGESLNMLIAREKEALNEILDDYKDKKILIVGHSTAFASLLTLWSDVDFEWRISISMTACILTVDIHLAILIDAFEMKPYCLAFVCFQF